MTNQMEELMTKIPMTTPSDKEIKDTIRSYSRFHWAQMRGRGFAIELEDVEGEFGVVYAQALKGYNMQSSASFGTYLHKAFENRIKTLKATMARSWTTPVIPLAGGDVVDPDTIENSMAVIDERDAQKRFSDGLIGAQKIIFDELMNPSAPVIAHMRAGKGATRQGSHVAAICAVYNMTRAAYYATVKNLKAQHILLDKESVSA